MFAADALLTGSAPLPQIGALLRGMTPGLEVNPIASLLETTMRDVPDSPVLGPDDSLAMLTGDVRHILHELAGTASQEDLGAAWRAARDVRTWALDLCTRVEAELAARAPGDATMEWWISRQLPAYISPWRNYAPDRKKRPVPPCQPWYCCFSANSSPRSTGYSRAANGTSHRHRASCPLPSVPFSCPLAHPPLCRPLLRNAHGRTG